MSEQYPASAKVYSTENLGKWSILDMLAYFEEKGAMRVSDLHIKIGVPPVYRVDGDLEKLKGPVLTKEMAGQAIRMALPTMMPNSGELSAPMAAYRLPLTFKSAPEHPTHTTRTMGLIMEIIRVYPSLVV